MLDIDLYQRIELDLQRDIVGRRIAVLGDSGQGKTNTAAVLVEELLSAGLPLTIVDIEGEYWVLKEKYQILVVGSGKHTDFPAGPDQAAALAELSINEAVSMILDLSDFISTEQQDFLHNYFGSLWAASSKAPKPYEVIIEEAHEFVPERVRNPLKELLTRIALRGRKRGLGAIIMSHRPTKVSKDFLTQAELLFLHRVAAPVDLKVYTDLIPLLSKQVEEMVGQLEPGQVIFIYNHEAQQIQIRQRHTFQGGASLQLDVQTAVKLQQIDEKLLDKLDEAVKPFAAGKLKVIKSVSELQQIKRVQELEEEIERLKDLVNDQALELATLKDLRTYLENQHPGIRVINNLTEIDQTGSAGQKVQLPDQYKIVQGEVVQLSKEHQESVKTNIFQLRKELNDYDRRHLASFQRKLGMLTDREVSLLTFLMEKDGNWFSRQDLFKYTGIPMGHFRRDFKLLLELPFIESQGMKLRTAVIVWAKFVSPGVEPATIFRFVQASAFEKK